MRSPVVVGSATASDPAAAPTGSAYCLPGHSSAITNTVAKGCLIPLAVPIAGPAAGEMIGPRIELYGGARTFRDP